MRAILGLFAALLISASASSAAAGLDALSNADAARGLKQALADASAAAIARLGKTDGFFGNPQVKIPLPKSMQRIEGALRLFGKQDEADELVLAMNRAAESAVPEAKALLADAIRNMSVSDAKGILTGGDTAATEYFRRATQANLSGRFLPIVKKVTDRSGLARQYNALAGQGMSFGLVSKDEATVENYVTSRALDGLYFMIAEQEKQFRRDPVGAASGIVRKVFGVLH